MPKHCAGSLTCPAERPAMSLAATDLDRRRDARFARLARSGRRDICQSSVPADSPHLRIVRSTRCAVSLSVWRKSGLIEGFCTHPLTVFNEMSVYIDSPMRNNEILIAQDQLRDALHDLHKILDKPHDCRDQIHCWFKHI